MNEFNLLMNRPVTFAVMILCGLVFFRQSRDSGLIGRYAFNYYKVRQGEWYRMITGGFLHGGVWHILMNMYSLFYLGTWMEGRLGPVRFAILLLGGVIAGHAGCYLLRVRSAVGLSGGLYAVLFFYFALLVTRGSVSWVDLIRRNIMMIFINFMPGVAWQGHLGGAVFGVAVSFLF